LKIIPIRYFETPGAKHGQTQCIIPDKTTPYPQSCEKVKNFNVVVYQEGSQQNSAYIIYFTHLGVSFHREIGTHKTMMQLFRSDIKQNVTAVDWV
jgi:hypothetical protein